MLTGHYVVWVWNTHISEGAIEERKTSQLRNHLELVVSNQNSGNGDLGFNYVSNSELCWVHLKKAIRGCYKTYLLVLSYSHLGGLSSSRYFRT